MYTNDKVLRYNSYMCIKSKKTNARSKSYELVSDSIGILDLFRRLHYTSEQELPRYQSETLELMEFYAKAYIDFFKRDLELFLKIEKDRNLNALEKTSINTYLNRKLFDTVAKLLYVSQLELLDRGVFILSQLLGDIYFYSENNQESETYKGLDENYRSMAENLLIAKKINLPKSVGLSRKYMKKHNLVFPPTEQILIKYLPVYVKDHPNLSLTSDQLYKDYAMLSDAIHSGLTANFSTEHLSNYKDIAGISVRVRMMLEILNTYYFDNSMDDEVNKWLQGFLNIKDDFLKDYLKVIHRD